MRDPLSRLYLARVLDIDDPDRLGRIKVRIDAKHDDVPDEHLPWAMPVSTSHGHGALDMPSVGHRVYVQAQDADSDELLYFGNPIAREGNEEQKLPSIFQERYPHRVGSWDRYGNYFYRDQSDGSMELASSNGTRFTVDERGNFRTLVSAQGKSKPVPVHDRARDSFANTLRASGHVLEGNMDVEVEGNLQISAKGNIILKAGQSLHSTSGSTTHIFGSIIHLNESSGGSTPGSGGGGGSPGQGGSGGGITETQVEVIVRRIVRDAAEEGNTQVWPAEKLGTGTANATKVLHGDGTWKDAPTSQTGVTPAQVDDRILAPARTGNTDRWGTEKLGSGTASMSAYLRGDGTWTTFPTIPGDSEIDARIADYARASPTGTIPDAQIPTSIARDSEIDGHIATFARANSPSGTIPQTSIPILEDGKIPATIARDSEIASYAKATGATGEIPVERLPTIPADKIHSDIARDSEIADYARASSPSGTVPTAQIPNIPDAKIPNTIARGTDIATYARASGASGIVPAAQLGSGTADSSSYLRGDNAWTTFPTIPDDAAIDARIATFARANSPSGTAPVERLGTGTTGATKVLYGDGAWKDAPDEGLTQSQVDDRILAPARTGNTDRWGTGKLGTGTASISAYLRGDGEWTPFPSIPGNSEIDGRILEPARTGNTDRWTPAKLGTGTRDGTKFLRDDGAWTTFPTIPDTTAIDARISDYARATPSGKIADDQIPDGITRDTEVENAAKVGNSTRWTTGKLGTGTPDATKVLYGDGEWTDPTSTIDARIADYAKASPTGMIANAQIPDSIARDSEIANEAKSGNTTAWGPTKLGTGTRDGTKFLRDDGTWQDTPTTTSLAASAITISASGFDGNLATTDDDAQKVAQKLDDLEIPSNSDIDDRIATFARATDATGEIPVERLGTGARTGTKYLKSDGAWTDPSSDIDTRIATFARANSPSGTIPDAQIPASIARDSEIASYARTTPSGTIPDAQIPASIARDSEIRNEAKTSDNNPWPVAKLGTGTANSGTVLYGDGKWKDAPSGGGGSGSGVPTTLENENADTAVDVATGSSAGVWTSWTDVLTAEALTADGVVSIFCDLVGNVTTSPRGGGDRVYVNTRVVRTRTATDDTQSETYFYVRNNGQSTAVLNTATQQLTLKALFYDDAEAGDVYKVQARVISQVAARTFRFSTKSRMQIVKFGGSGGAGALTELSDTPANYTGQAGKILAVNSGATALEFTDAPSSGLSQVQVDARIAPYARATPSGTIADAQIPSSIARDSEIPSNSDIDARIATWARVNSPSGAIPDSSIPASIARDSEIASYAKATSPTGTIPLAQIPTLDDDKIPTSIARDSEIADEAKSGNMGVWSAAKVGTGTRTGTKYLKSDGAWTDPNSDIDARIAPYARATPSGMIADAQIPASIARDSEIASYAKATDPTGRVPVGNLGTGTTGATKVLYGDGAWKDAPSTTSLAATAIAVSASGFNGNLATTDDNAQKVAQKLDDLDIDARIATFARANSPSGTIPDAQIPASIARDSEIASYARTTPSGTIPDAQIPASIARDSEIDGHIVTWARTNSPSGTIPLAQIPASIARGTDIATYARASSPSGTIPLAQIPDSIARDSEIDGHIATFARANSPSGTIPTARIPSATTAAQGAVELATSGEMTAGTANKIPDAAVVKSYVDGQAGLDQTAVDARVRALVADPAEQGNTDRWTPAKLGTGTANSGTVLHGDGAWKAPATASLATDGTTWATSRQPWPTDSTAYTNVSGTIGNTYFDVADDAPAGVNNSGATNRLYVAIPRIRPDASILGIWVSAERSSDGGTTWSEVHRVFKAWGPGTVTTDTIGITSPSTGILTLDTSVPADAAGRTAAIVGVEYAVYEGHGGSFIYITDQGGPRPRGTINSVAQRYRLRVFPCELKLAGLQGPKGDPGRDGAAQTILDADFTPSMAAAALGSVSTRSSPRSLTAPTPNTIDVAADGTLPAGISVASNVITFTNAGRVVLDGVFIVQARDSAANNNNSRSRVVIWAEKASSTGNFEAINGSVSTSEYIRVSYDYWNHGCGYAYLHDHSEFLVSAGDRIRIRIAALFNQANTVTHGVVAANPDSNLLPGSGFHITHTA